MTLYVENPKVPLKKLLQPNSLIKLQNTKSLQKNLSHFYKIVINYHKEKLGKQFHWQFHQNWTRVSCIEDGFFTNWAITEAHKIPTNKLKRVKCLYTENYKTLMKRIEAYTNKWKDTSCLWIRRINIAKMSILPKAESMQFRGINAIPIKIPVAFFTEIEQATRKLV